MNELINRFQTLKDIVKNKILDETDKIEGTQELNTVIEVFNNINNIANVMNKCTTVPNEKKDEMNNDLDELVDDINNYINNLLDAMNNDLDNKNKIVNETSNEFSEIIDKTEQEINKITNKNKHKNRIKIKHLEDIQEARKQFKRAQEITSYSVEDAYEIEYIKRVLNNANMLLQHLFYIFTYSEKDKKEVTEVWVTIGNFSEIMYKLFSSHSEKTQKEREVYYKTQEFCNLRSSKIKELHESNIFSIAEKQFDRMEDCVFNSDLYIAYVDRMATRME